MKVFEKIAYTVLLLIIGFWFGKADWSMPDTRSWVTYYDDGTVEYRTYIGGLDADSTITIPPQEDIEI